MPEAHAGSCLVMVDFNTLFLAGGYGGSAIGYTNKTFTLDRRVNLWSRMADMPTGRSVLYRVHPETEKFNENSTIPFLLS